VVQILILFNLLLLVTGCVLSNNPVTSAPVITEFALPTQGGVPYEITAGPDGNLWFTEILGGTVEYCGVFEGLFGDFVLIAFRSDGGILKRCVRIQPLHTLFPSSEHTIVRSGGIAYLHYPRFEGAPEHAHVAPCEHG
jgi:hypothetical protein